MRAAHVRDGAAIVRWLAWLDDEMRRRHGPSAGYFEPRCVLPASAPPITSTFCCSPAPPPTLTSTHALSKLAQW